MIWELYLSKLEGKKHVLGFPNNNVCMVMVMYGMVIRIGKVVALLTFANKGEVKNY